MDAVKVADFPPESTPPIPGMNLEATGLAQVTRSEFRLPFSILSPALQGCFFSIALPPIREPAGILTDTPVHRGERYNKVDERLPTLQGIGDDDLLTLVPIGVRRVEPDLHHSGHG